MSTFACRDCNAPTKIERSGNPAADAFGKFLRCELCAAEHERAEAERDRQKAHEEHLRRVSATLPKAVRGYRFSTSPAPVQARRAAERWAREGGRLALIGPVGTGKTGLAAAAVWTRLYAKEIAWASVPTWLANLTASFDDEDRSKALSVLRGKRAICLDDIDKFNGGDWAASQLFAALDNVLTADGDLLITSNKTPGALAAHIGGDIGPAIASRLNACEIVRVDGPDQRINPTQAAA